MYSKSPYNFSVFDFMVSPGTDLTTYLVEGDQKTKKFRQNSKIDRFKRQTEQNDTILFTSPILLYYWKQVSNYWASAFFVCCKM